MGGQGVQHGATAVKLKGDQVAADRLIDQVIGALKVSLENVFGGVGQAGVGRQRQADGGNQLAGVAVGFKVDLGGLIADIDQSDTGPAIIFEFGKGPRCCSRYRRWCNRPAAARRCCRKAQTRLRERCFPGPARRWRRADRDRRHC